ncbi:MAG TPA: type IIL restriction-modification enzyme MmeI, partial [Flavipsychrobacter sp.]|nr:type IIL restriction-modification enzyme MmeI [Flavipsychrobacter sp.]
GEYYVRLPLRRSATIEHGNALRIDWQSLIKEEGVYYDYIIGNPPFLGKQFQNSDQKSDMELVFGDIEGAGLLDYVSAWYLLAARYMNHHKIDSKIKTAFVSTNSISQGEQVSALWKELFANYGVKIHFAYRTFKWNNEARGNAAVHVIIVGFANFDVNEKLIFDNTTADSEKIRTDNINPYLVAGKDNWIPLRKKPICSAPEMSYGSMANDGGNLILSDEEKKELISKDPTAEKFIKKFLGSYEFINKIDRWCIWLKDVSPDKYSSVKGILNRISLVREYRNNSTRQATRKLADFPMLFGETRQPQSDYLLVPGVSSENRKYIPIGFLSSEIIASDLARTVANATKYHFGVITSLMHMTWVKYTCGRLKSDYRYSSSLVYNNFPWPENPGDKQKEAVEKAAQAVLDARAQFPDSSLADLYDPNTMPPALVKAHQQLDKAVDLCYRPQPFVNETKRIEYLFELYDKYTAGLFVEEKKGKKGKKERKVKTDK